MLKKYRKKRLLASIEELKLMLEAKIISEEEYELERKKLIEHQLYSKKISRKQIIIFSILFIIIIGSVITVSVKRYYDNLKAIKVSQENKRQVEVEYDKKIKELQNLLNSEVDALKLMCDRYYEVWGDALNNGTNVDNAINALYQKNIDNGAVEERKKADIEITNRLYKIMSPPEKYKEVYEIVYDMFSNYRLLNAGGTLKYSSQNYDPLRIPSMQILYDNYGSGTKKLYESFKTSNDKLTELMSTLNK